MNATFSSIYHVYGFKQEKNKTMKMYRNKIIYSLTTQLRYFQHSSLVCDTWRSQYYPAIAPKTKITYSRTFNFFAISHKSLLHPSNLYFLSLKRIVLYIFAIYIVHHFNSLIDTHLTNFLSTDFVVPFFFERIENNIIDCNILSKFSSIFVEPFFFEGNENDDVHFQRSIVGRTNNFSIKYDRSAFSI